MTVDEVAGGPPTVSEILARRARGGRPPAPLTAGLSLLAHAAFIVALLFAGRPRRVPVAIPISLPVRVVSPAALGRPEAAPVPAAPVAEPAPESAKAPPVIEKRREEKVPPSPKAMPAPKSPKAKPTPPAAAAGKGAPAVDLPAAAGLPNGTAGATGAALSFGADVAAFDSDFPFSYYVQQLVSLIGANWFRPDAPDGTLCTVSFRIQRSGEVADVRVEATSGITWYDRAAVRAVFAANPLPPLPNDYRNEQLGVHLRFR